MYPQAGVCPEEKLVDKNLKKHKRHTPFPPPWYYPHMHEMNIGEKLHPSGTH
jgi:hypothetical protein